MYFFKHAGCYILRLPQPRKGRTKVDNTESRSLARTTQLKTRRYWRAKRRVEAAPNNTQLQSRLAGHQRAILTLVFVAQ